MQILLKIRQSKFAMLLKFEMRVLVAPQDFLAESFDEQNKYNKRTQLIFFSYESKAKFFAKAKSKWNDASANKQKITNLFILLKLMVGWWVRMCNSIPTFAQGGRIWIVAKPPPPRKFWACACMIRLYIHF